VCNPHQTKKVLEANLEISTALPCRISVYQEGEVVKDTYSFVSPDRSPTQVIESFRRFYGRAMSAFEAAEKSGRVEELHDQLVELANAKNKSTDGGTSIPATFLRVTVCL
jgi:Domain of unknown function DUF302